MSPAPKAPRRFTPKFAKPITGYCAGCDLETRGSGYVPAAGTADLPILLVGEAPWYDEVALGMPFAGASGSMLTRVLTLIGKSREQVRIDNCLRCAVPDMQIDRWPGAVSNCRYVDDAIRAAPPTVIVPMGGASLRRILQLPRGKNTKVENFHGTVTWSDLHQAWIVPTYHPSHLQRGAVNLMGVMAFDLQRAFEVSTYGWAPDPATWVIDPPLDWLRAWADAYIAAATQDPYAYPLAVDLETPEKDADEASLIGSADDLPMTIKRVNLSCHPDEGITFVPTPDTIEILRQILLVGGVQYYWYKGFDYPRLAHLGMPMRPDRAWDVMWMAKVVQSDLPMGLGFHAPFHSRFGAWKHLSEAEPGKYAAVDAFQTRRVGDGYVTDLHAAGQWDAFERHLHRWHYTTLQPATEVGIAIDRTRLDAYAVKLEAAAGAALLALDDLVPAEDRPLTPKAGLRRPPAPEDVHTKSRATKKDGTAKKEPPDPVKATLYARARVIEKLVIAEVLLCDTCGALQVSKTHKCPKGEAALAKRPASVRRWYWQEPFNADSPPQLMAYALAHGHPPGKSKQTGEPSMDREALTRLMRDTDDPLYEGVLNYRAVQKVRSTYVLGTLKRLDADDRVHPTTTFKASTMRTTQVNPNFQNIKADKDGKGSLAAGFRDVVVARGRWVEAGSGWEDVEA